MAAKTPPPGSSFTADHEAVTQQVAAQKLAESQKVRKSFGERPYNAPLQTPDEQKADYAVVRNDPNYLNDIHDTYRHFHFLTPDVFDKEFILGVSSDEAKHRLSTGELDQSQYDKAMAAIEAARGRKANGAT